MIHMIRHSHSMVNAPKQLSRELKHHASKDKHIKPNSKLDKFHYPISRTMSSMITIVPVKVHNELVLSLNIEWRAESSKLMKSNKAAFMHASTNM